MSDDRGLILSRIEPGSGWALDLGGGVGTMREGLLARGYRYVNLDVSPRGAGAVIGDAHVLPFADGSLDLVVSVDSLEHFLRPGEAMAEIARVLVPGGRIVIWVPFMHPFHGDDYWRYTPLGIRHLFDEAGLQITDLEAPLWATSVIARVIEAFFTRRGTQSWVGGLRSGAAWIDDRLRRFQGEGKSVAAVYLIRGEKAG